MVFENGSNLLQILLSFIFIACIVDKEIYDYARV